MREIRYGPHCYYKGRFFIVFYDEKDERLQYMFDNVREILKFQQKDFSRSNVNRVNVEIYLALRRKGHQTRFLNGQLLRLYLIDLENECDYAIVWLAIV